MQQLANNALLIMQESPGQTVQNTVKLTENKGFSDAFQQAQAKVQPAGDNALGQQQYHAANAASQHPASETASGDKVASVLGQISMGKKLPPAERLQQALVNVGKLCGLTPTQLQQIAQMEPQTLQQQFGNLLQQQLQGQPPESGEAEKASDADAKADDADSELDAFASLTALFESLGNLLQHTMQSGQANAAQASLDEEGDAALQALLLQLQAPASGENTELEVDAEADMDTDAPLPDAEDGNMATQTAAVLAQLLTALQAFSAATDAAGTPPTDDGQTAAPSAVASLSQLQQLLAQWQADKPVAANTGTVADTDIGNRTPQAASSLSSLLGQKNESGLPPATAVANAAPETSPLAASADMAKMASMMTDTTPSAEKTDKTPALQSLVMAAQERAESASSFNTLLSASANELRSEPAHYQLSLRTAGGATPNGQELLQRFAPAMRQQLLTMVNNGIQHAEIRLDPPDLGAMTVKLQVQGEHTQVQFHVTQTHTRELLEQSMPRLRDLLQQQGMQLADGQVSQGGGQQSHARQQAEQGGFGNGTSGEISGEETTVGAEPLLTSTSAIDYYA
ncbi:flagellar hook-length control protein FliK [Shewanella sp. YIC-542]|uniref:flagellar hook-length control protein FliK n=1 Tax=Shewanella mytili TaxID=3377111 RepID=UPI00398F0DBF